MKIKKILLMMVLLTIAGRAFADEITVSPVSMNAGETKKVAINLDLSSEIYSALEFDLVLPKGISVALNSSNKLRILIADDHRQIDEDEQKSHSISFNQSESDENSTTYKVVIYDGNNAKLKSGSGAIANCYIKADESASGSLTAYVKNILLAASGGSGGTVGGTKLTDASFTITVAGKPTVTADDKSREYGDANPELTYTVNGGTITETPVLTTTATATSPVGTYDIVVPASANYTAANGVLTVTKAPLTISGGTYSIKQGESLPTFTAEYSGFKNNETSAVLTAQPTLTLAAGVTGASAPGNYDITVAGATADNYEITFQKGTLTITAADPVTVTAKSYEITYGDAIPTFEYTSEGATLNGTPAISCEATSTSGAGTYPITITKGSVTNYNDSYVNGTLTIKKAALTIKADDKSKEYGEANPELTCTYSGFVKSETSAVLTTQPTLSTEATVASGANTYDITASGAAAANYEISYAKGTLTVTKATLTATAKSYTRKQGEANPDFEVEYSGWKNSDGVASLTTVPTAATTATPTSAPNTYDITVSGGESDNYSFAYVKGTLTVTAADPVTVTAKSYEITYGDALPDFSYTTEGAALNGEPTITCTATTASGAGTYPITITKGSVTNYNDSYVNGTLTIKKAALTIKADDKSKEYGEANPELTCTYSGFVKEETNAVLTTQPTLGTSATDASGAGTYDITVTGAEADNYEITQTKGTLTVTKAPLTISGGTYSIKQGESLPTFTAEYSGFKNNETSAVLTAQPTLTLAAGVTGASAPGNYDITVAGATADNYEITFQKGTLTISEADLVTVTAKSYEITYGDALPDFSYTTEGAALNGEPTITCAATADSNAGTYDIVISKGSVTNYNDTYVNGTLTINKAPLTITVEDKSKTYGDTNPEFTASYTGFVKEQTSDVLTTKPTLSTEATTATGIGTYPIKASGAIADNYTFTYVDGTLTINPLVASLTWSNTELTYNGQEQKPTATVSNLVGNDQCTVTVSGASNAGNHTSTATALSNANYKLPEAADDKSQAFSIAQLEATLAWSNTELTYNGQEQNPTATVSNRVGEDACTVTVSGATNAGNHTSTASALSNSNYKLSDVAVNISHAFTIAPKGLAVAADAKTKMFGENDPTLTYTSEGLIGEDAITGELAREAGDDVGEYNITQGTLTAGDNYTISFTGAKLTITAAALAGVTASGYEGTYDGDAHTINVTIPEGAAILYGTTEGTYELDAAPSYTNAGNYTTYYQVTKANYSAVAGSQTVAIAKKTLAVAAEAKTKVYGEADPNLTYTSDGLVSTDAISGALTRTAGDNVGEYDITQGTLTAGDNYAISYTGAKLSVTQKEATLAWNNIGFTYNGQEQKPTAMVSNLVGNDQCTVTVSGATNAGNHTSTASELSNTNYKLPEAKTQAFAIAPAALTISCGSYTMKQGEALPQFQAEYDGFVNGETENVVTTKPTFTTTATSASVRGSYEVTVSGALAANYDITYQNGTLIVTEVVVADGGTTIEQGTDDYYVVTIDEEGGVSSENGVIGDTQLDNEGKIDVAELIYTRELDAPTGETGDVTIEGSIAKLYTTCLPETPKTAANAKYYTLDAVNSTTLTFTEVDNSNLAANTPYLVAVFSGSDLNESQNVTNVTLKKEADNRSEKDGFAFKGTLTGLTNAEAAAAGAYILQIGNVWGKVTTAHPNAYIPPFRAYIVSTSANAPEILNCDLGEGTTSIQNIRTVDLNGTERWYDLNGKRILKPTKGINIQNGRKVFVK